MPHVIIEHSANFPKNSIQEIQTEIQKIMASITEGNFDPDQCRCRSISFDEYLVGFANQSNASFIHISIKLLSGRSVEVRKKLAAKSRDFVEKIFNELGLKNNRCDISVDVIEMDRETYQKIRIS
ncbi:MAG: hypothetical protein KGP29_00605 [Proteobacteria bacterium]|nr:hypothetical protein [Pseudomonadota bacterium]